MGETNKAVRLSKVAREFNVGISTIVDYLGGQGIDVDANPNTKIDSEVYDKLLDEFQSDKSVKEKSKSVNRQRSERETVTLESAKKEDEEEAPEEEIDLSKLKEIQEKAEKAEKALKPAAKKEVAPPVEEPAPEPEPKAEPVVEEVKEEAPAEKAPEAVEAKEEAPAEKPVEEEKSSTGPKVVGKMDLADLESRSKKPSKGKKEDRSKAKVEAKAEPKAAEKKPEPKVVEAPAKKEEAPAAATPPPPVVREEVHVIKAEAKKLSGPTVVGKIELPKEVDRKKENDNKKRKRKRVAKVDVEKQAKEARNRPKTSPEGRPIVRAKGGQGTAGPPSAAGSRRKRDAKPEVNQADIQREIKETLARLSGGGKSKSSKLRRAKRDMVQQRAEEEMIRQEEEATILKLTEFVTVSELASLMDRPATDIISACMSLGIFASINQRLDAETISIVAEEFGFTVEFVSAEVQESILVEEDQPEDLISRPPIITVMGHVDHGKTSLLDYIRSANVIGGEAGGITQHIGAYSVKMKDDKVITFLDTPGHEAFTAMRARGAQVTDLAIIVIAADDSVMPQTREAINHAQAANIPMIFAFNKIDKEGANSDKIREELSGMNILVEDWGGKFQSQEISAKKGLGIDELLEKVLLEAELLELQANPKKRAVGTVIESSLDKGRGYVTTLLVEAGTLNVGDPILAGQWSGRVKAMFNERAQTVKSAGPSMPVSILGMQGAPSAGDKFYVLEDEKEVRSIATKRQQLQREQGVRAHKHITIEEIGRRIALGEFKELNLIVKGDVDGSIEALSDSLQKLSTEKIQVNIIHKAVGAISESDVLLASASDAIVVGFQVRPSASARRLAEKEEIQIRLYSVIYKAIEEIKDAMEGMLSTKTEEKIVGTAEIRETFKISKVGTIAGCFVLEGKIFRNHKVRVIRDGIVVYSGTLGSLKRFKDDVKEVAKGFECGLNIDKFNDIHEGDLVEAFEEIEVKQTL